MAGREPFALEEARRYGQEIGSTGHLHRSSSRSVELACRSSWSTAGPIATARIALAHLNEFPDYHKRLNRMEKEAEQ
jgi:hypothetical protein